MTPPIRTLTTADTTFHYRELGEGRPVLLLHGWPTSSYLWRNVMPHLAAAGLRPIALDLPAFGRTVPAPGASLSFRYYERAIESFLDGLGVTQTDLVVHDVGGPIGLYWASQHPERVRALTLLNTLVYPQVSWAVVAFMAATRVPLLNRFIASQAGVRLALKLGTHAVSPAKEVLDEYAAPFSDDAARSLLLRAGLRLAPSGFVTLSRWLESTHIPLAAIYGERDRILPDIAKTIARLARAQPRLDVQRLPDCAHFIQEERPDDIGQRLAAFHARP